MSGTGTRATAAARTRAALAGLLAVGGVLAPGGLVSSGPVSAIYPIPVPEITTDSSVYGPGEKTTVTLEGFVDCPQVVITVDGPRSATTAEPDGEGRVTVEMDAPEDEGEYEITATCVTGEQTATTTIEVSVPGEVTVPTDPPVTDGPDTTATGGGSLPSTGSEAGDPLRAGMVLVGAGALFLLVTRRRAAGSR